MKMYVAGAQKRLVFKMVILQICDAVAHVLFATEKWLFPNNLAISNNSGIPLHALGKSAYNQLWANRAGSELTVRKIKIIDFFGFMIRKLVAESKSEAVWMSVIADQINSHNFCFIT